MSSSLTSAISIDTSKGGATITAAVAGARTVTGALSARTSTSSEPGTGTSNGSAGSSYVRARGPASSSQIHIVVGSSNVRVDVIVRTRQATEASGGLQVGHSVLQLSHILG